MLDANTGRQMSWVMGILESQLGQHRRTRTLEMEDYYRRWVVLVVIA